MLLISSSLKTPNAQCCIEESSFLKSQYCGLIVGSVKENENNTELESTILKEICGYLVFGFYNYTDQRAEEEFEKFKDKRFVQCKDGKNNYSHDYIYTSEQIKILQSETQCESYLYSSLLGNYLYNKTLVVPNSKEDCFNAGLTQPVKKEGMKCLHASFQLKLLNGSYSQFSTCYMLDKNFKKKYLISWKC